VRSVRSWLLAAALATLALAALPSGAGAVTVTNLTTVPGVIVDANPTAVLYRPSGDQTEPLTVRHLPSGTEETVTVPTGRQMRYPDARLFGDGVIFVTYPSGSDQNPVMDEWHFGTSTATSLGAANGFTDEVAGDYAVWSVGSTVTRRQFSTETSTTITTHAGTVGDTPSVAPNGDVVYTDDAGPPNVHRWHAGTDTAFTNTSDLVAVSPVTDGTNVVWALVPPCCGNPGGSIVVNGTEIGDTGDSIAGEDINRKDNYAVDGGWTGFTRTSQSQVTVRSPDGVLSPVSADGASNRLVVRDVNAHGQVAYYRGFSGQGATFLGAPGLHPFPFRSDDPSVFWSGDHWYVIRGANTLGRVETDTAITAQPADPTKETTAHFEVASTAAHDPVFTCTLDEQPADCSSGEYNASSLGDGQHTFTATSHDPDLNETDATPVSFTWTVDATPPTAFELTNPSDGDFRRPSQMNFAWTAADDPGTGVAHYELYIDDNKVQTLDGGTTSTAQGDLTEGPHTWKVRAIDAAGNHRDESGSFTVDGTPPTVPPLTAPDDEATLLDATPTLHWGAASDDSGVTGYRVYIDGERVETLGPDARSYTQPEPLDDGEHSWGIGAVDAAGNLNGETRHFTIDTSPQSHPGPPGISINDGDQFTNDPDVTLTARWPKHVRNMLIANDGGFGGAEPTPVAFHVPWTLESSGPERLPKTVYVRYLGGSAGNETYTDDIILDETSPLLLMARFAPASGKHRYAIKLRARDEVSGVHKAQLAHRKGHPGRVLKYHRTLKVRAAARPRFARVRDRAGNWSHWRKIAPAH
jgi:hypothetical protein